MSRKCEFRRQHQAVFVRRVSKVITSFTCCCPAQGTVPEGTELCGGEDMAKSTHVSFERLKAGDESAAVFKSDVGELMVRPR